MVYSIEHAQSPASDPEESPMYLKNYQEKLQGYFLSILKTHQLAIAKFKYAIENLSGDELFDLIDYIYLLKALSKDIKDKEAKIQEELFRTIYVSEPGEFDGIKDSIRCLKRDVNQLKKKLEEFNKNGAANERFDIDMRSDEQDNDDDEIIEFMNSNTSSRISQKVHLSNNIVSYIKGPVKIVVHGAMQVAEALARNKNATDEILQAIKDGVEKQKPAFVEITSDWTYVGENTDKGFSSNSLWMKNPQNEKILIKIQDLPICAVNEWLAYVLGRKIGLPVNKVQIAIYENKLVTLHQDVNQGNEKTISFDELPRRIKKTLMTDSIIGSMDLFDRLIMNVDRNPRNILVTISDTIDIEDKDAKLKVHLIDHSACFGMGKLNGISVMASKLHTSHLSIVKYEPIEEATKFDRYLNKLSSHDRVLIGKTLTRLASITDQQIEGWLEQVQSLLTSTQYDRIYELLYRQCDIARRYVIQWRISSRSSSVTSKDKV